MCLNMHFTIYLNRDVALECTFYFYFDNARNCIWKNSKSDHNQSPDLNINMSSADQNNCYMNS